MLTKPYAALLSSAALIAAQIAGASIGPTRGSETKRWYDTLDRSELTPPGPVFGIVWTILNSLQAYSGYRLMIARPSRSRTAALLCWATCVAGVAAHPWTLFKRRRLDEATAVTAGMVAGSIGLLAAAKDVDRPAAWAGVPLVAWVSFAMYLQGELLRKNGSGKEVLKIASSF